MALQAAWLLYDAAVCACVMSGMCALHRLHYSCHLHPHGQ